MTIKQALYQGYAEVARRKKIVFVWYAANLLCAIAIVAPLVVGIASALGESLENQRLFENFDASWVIEFGYSGRWEQFTAYAPVAALATALFFLATTWLSGGALAILKDPDDSFFAGCARWFPPFLRLLLWSLIGYAIAFGVRAGMRAAINKIADDNMSAQPAAYGSMIGFAVFWAALLFVNMIVDYAKIHMVTHGDRKSRRALLAALRFVFANLGRAIAIFAALTAVGLLLLAVYHVWSEVIGQSSLLAVLLLFIVRQAYMFSRTWLRMVFFASQRLFFVNLIPMPPAPAPVPDDLYDSSML